MSCRCCACLYWAVGGGRGCAPRVQYKQYKRGARRRAARSNRRGPTRSLAPFPSLAWPGLARSLVHVRWRLLPFFIRRAGNSFSFLLFGCFIFPTCCLVRHQHHQRAVRVRVPHGGCGSTLAWPRLEQEQQTRPRQSPSRYRTNIVHRRRRRRCPAILEHRIG